VSELQQDKVVTFFWDAAYIGLKKLCNL